MRIGYLWENWRLVNNVEIDTGQIGWVGVDWIGLAQNRDNWGDLVNSVMNIRVP
jgi:hypothetical protein